MSGKRANQMRTVTVALIHTDRPFWRRVRRWQPWRWVAKASNGRILATSGESYVNRRDAVNAIVTVFGAGTDIMFDTGAETRLLRSRAEFNR